MLAEALLRPTRRLMARRRGGSGTGASMAIDDIATEGDRLAALAARLPRPMRFIAVGCLGLFTDLCTFTAIIAHFPHPLAVRLLSLLAGTLVTWRLNRALTFKPDHRAQSNEALRYAVVTAVAQATSYAVFAAGVLTWLGALPQAALMCGALVGAFVSYNGHRLFSFAPRARDVAFEGAPRE